jgi:LPS-assembly protein
MTVRIRIFITTVALCHLFLAHGRLISQLRAGVERTATRHAVSFDTAVKQVDPASPTAPVKPGEPVTIKYEKGEKVGDLYKLRGDVEIDFRNYVLKADEMTYDDRSGEATATGHVVLNGGPHDEHITASHGHYNVNTESGVFFDVVGSTGAKLRGRGVVLTSSNPFIFTGTEVEQQGRDKIIVRHGWVTSCKLPKPKWTFNAHEVVVVPGENAKIYHSTFHLFGLPLFYLPFVEHPVERLPRQTGLLIPHAGNSTTKGFIFGDAFYWAINRSADATIGMEYYSRRGFAQRGEFRARPSDSSFINFNYFGVIDRGTPITQAVFVPGVGETTVNSNPGGEEAQLNAEAQLPFHFRGVASIDYLSQFLFRAVYADRFSEAINTEVKSTAFASRTDNGHSYNLMFSRYQNFQSATPGDLITIVHAPAVDLGSVDEKIGKTPLYYSYDTSFGGVSRREPNFVTANVVGRFDAVPSLSAPLHFKGWDFRPELDLHETYYTERLLPSATGIGMPAANPVNRKALETAFEITPPTIGKIFEHPVFNHKIKHVIEPRFRYDMVTGVNNFQNILRFDERDVLSDTNEVEYGLVNRLYAKHVPKPGCPATSGLTPQQKKADSQKRAKDATGKPRQVEPEPVPTGCETAPAREIASWELVQKYFFDPTFGGALVPGRRNVFTTTTDLTGIAFLTGPRHFSPIISRLRLYTGAGFDGDWQLDYDTQKGRINASTALVSYHFLTNFTFAAGHAFLQTPGEVIVSQPILSPTEFNQFRVQLNYGNLNRRGWNAASVVGYDVHQGFLQYAAVQSSYNWDCCGLTFEYRRFNLVGSIRDETQYRFALTLANLGTFGTLRKQERLY